MQLIFTLHFTKLLCQKGV